MNGFTRTPWRIVKSHAVWIGLTLLAGGFVGSGTVDGSPIHKDHLSHETHDAAVEPSHRYRSWSAYLLGGPSVWSHVIHPPVTPAVVSAIWKAIRTDPPGDSNAWVHYLLYKQSLNPARFAHWHPGIAVALHRLAPPVTGPQVLSPAPGTSSSSGPPAPLQAQEIPEPMPWLIVLGMAGWGLWWRRRHR
jgi:hypothetical protein